MKRLIDMPDTIWDWIIWGFPDEEDKDKLIDLIKNSIPLPDNATNGEMLKAIFPDGIPSGEDSDDYFIKTDTDWWNAPYKADKE